MTRREGSAEALLFLCASACSYTFRKTFETINVRVAYFTGRGDEQKMAGGIPWAKIRNEWLKGGTTHQKLADKYGVKVKTIRDRAYKEGWGKQKGKIAEKVQAETRDRVVRARVNHLEKLITANEALLDGLMQLAGMIQKNPFQMMTDAQGTLRNAESFAKALKTATETQRDLYKMPNMDQKLARDKWKAEQKDRKAAAAELSGTVVRIECDEEGALDE